MRLLKAGFCAAAIVAGVALGMTGCVVSRNSDGSSTVWLPVVGHVHDDHCGHYRSKDSWYHSSGHRHGHGCGHHNDNGVWIVRH